MQRRWSQVGWRWLRGRARTRRRSRRLPTARPILARKGRTRSMDRVSSAKIAEINYLKPITCKLFCRAMDESRSEEHTSELQSLMRISYAVFCLKKKIQLH